MTTVQYAHHGDVRIAYERFGHDGEPLLLLGGHGRPSTWIPDGFCHALVDAGFTVVRFDNRDSGLSTHFDQHTAAGYVSAILRPTRRPPYPVTAFADDAAAVLDANDWPSAHLAGGSMGVGIALLLASRAPERVRSMTLLTGGYMHKHRILRYTRFQVLRGIVGRRFPPGADGEAEMTVAVMRMLASPHALDRFDDELARDIGRRSHARHPHDPAADRRQIAAGRTGDPWPFDRLPGVPIQVINGLDDPMIRATGGLDLARRLRAPIRFYPDMGHDLPRHLWGTLAADIRALASRSAEGTRQAA
ncbi:pimeloyl-ACP methyl ester carboxylesterase [Catenuloplanes nepalensis]|uniref:Pimeloyl-ACP methyl ester carboxylesterase n=1 Tax=Catenuloplanes nepalensis TaxID=587533 RepID=A0ABT9MSS2_9ACTN|nr:alpha/beta hydrolase [Catenuloplanes nepalensis]MDP9794489.1 pimeloyl-ACP methyl ester carboxylesterase [Catenuloplanes nepalensis]